MSIAPWPGRSTGRPVLPTNPMALLPWFLFALQILLIEALELGDDIIRGNILPPNPGEAVRHARYLVHLEQAHDLFIEPAVQLWGRHLHALFGLLSFQSVVQVTDFIYAAGQTIVPILLAVWIFRKHRAHWPRVRTIAFLMVLFCVIGYELYPVAPPRLTTGLSYAGSAFHFQDTVQRVIGDGTLNGVPIGYNAYSAMPSAHMAMALLVAACVLCLSRRRLVQLLASLYPVLMLFTVIVTGNHYLLDALGGAVAVMLAAATTLTIEIGYRRRAGALRPVDHRCRSRHGRRLPSREPVKVG